MVSVAPLGYDDVDGNIPETKNGGEGAAHTMSDLLSITVCSLTVSNVVLEDGAAKECWHSDWPGLTVAHSKGHSLGVSMMRSCNMLAILLNDRDHNNRERRKEIPTCACVRVCV